MAEGRSAAGAWDRTDPRLAAVTWARLAEPGDLAAATLVAERGHVGALDWVWEAPPQDVPCQPADPRVWQRARERWQPRLQVARPDREVAVITALGGTVLTREDPLWPPSLADLGLGEPHCLWIRGEAALPARAHRGVAIVGARASTSYGNQVAAELTAGLAARGVPVVSGGAYGIDAVAHRAVLAAEGETVAVMAGGLDRLYPAGNAELLAQVCRRGAVIAELGPGSAPTRSRFLTRNRLIAALAGACVVVEAGWRSGTLSTAGHAARLLRPVGAVPGAVTSAASAGCHRLLREQSAVCVTDVAEVMELLGTDGTSSGEGRDTSGREASDRARLDGGAPGQEASGRGPKDPPSGLTEEERALWEALPARGSAAPDSLMRASGLAAAEVRVALGGLELAGHLVREGARVRRVRR